MLIKFKILEQSHSSVERAGLLGGVILRSLDVDSDFKMTGDTLRKAIRDDKEKGLIPFYVSITRNGHTMLHTPVLALIDHRS